MLSIGDIKFGVIDELWHFYDCCLKEAQLLSYVVIVTWNINWITRMLAFKQYMAWAPNKKSLNEKKSTDNANLLMIKFKKKKKKI